MFFSVYLLLLPVSLWFCRFTLLIDCLVAAGRISALRLSARHTEKRFRPGPGQEFLNIHFRWLVCSRVRFIGPWLLTALLKSQQRLILNKGGHTWAGGPHTQFINITWCTMETLAGHSSLSKVCRLACQSHLWEGRDVWWILKMLSFLGAVRCERALQSLSRAVRGAVVSKNMSIK